MGDYCDIYYLHSCLDLKHLQLLVLHFLEPLYEHLTNPCPPLRDALVTAGRSEISVSMLINVTHSVIFQDKCQTDF